MAAIESRRLYRRPLPWVILSLTALLMAIFFMLLVVRYQIDESHLRNFGVTVEILMRYFGTATLYTLLLAPLLTMTSLSADKRDGGLGFLFALPVTALDIVGGKLLALLSLGAFLWFVIALIPLTLLWGATIDLGVYAGNALGLALFMMLHLSLGLLASSVTRQPVLAGASALSVSLALWFADWANRLDPEATVLGGLSSASRMRGFTVGLFNTADLIYFVAGTFACVLLSAWCVEGTRRYA